MKWFWVSTREHQYDSEHHILVAARNEDEITSLYRTTYSVRVKEFDANIPKPRKTKYPHIYNPWSKQP